MKLFALKASVFILLFISACNMPVKGWSTTTLNPTQVLNTVVAQVTIMAVRTKLVEQTITLQPRTSIPTVIFSPKPPSQPATDIPVPCDMAAAGKPIDITVPDDTTFSAGERFTKTWRLVNEGSCSWTRDYAVVWFSGEDLGVVRSQSFLSSVLPGQSVDISIEMLAPSQPGVYQSNWKLRNPQGKFFGIGPGSDSPFWVRIQVVAINTPTFTVTPQKTLTPTPESIANGILAMVAYDTADLDSGGVNIGAEDDLLFDRDSEGNYFLSPINGAYLGPVVSTAQNLHGCQSSATLTEPIALTGVAEDSYLCYQTDQNLPGLLRLSILDLENGLMTIEFNTWAIP